MKNWSALLWGSFVRAMARVPLGYFPSLGAFSMP